MQYETTQPFRLDGKDIEVGSNIELSKAQAAQYLELGHVVEVKAAKAPAKSKE